MLRLGQFVDVFYDPLLTRLEECKLDTGYTNNTIDCFYKMCDIKANGKK